MQKAEKVLLAKECAKALRQKDLLILEELEGDGYGWSVVSTRENGA